MMRFFLPKMQFLHELHIFAVDPVSEDESV